MRLFVSYSHEDTQRVLELVGILKDGGHEPWWDSLWPPGDDWKEELWTEIGRCEALVYCASPEAMSPTGANGRLHKRRKGKTVFPGTVEREGSAKGIGTSSVG